jgi:hypothetical protein
MSTPDRQIRDFKTAIDDLENAKAYLRRAECRQSTIELVDRAIMLAASEMQLLEDVRRRQLKQ